MRTLLATIGCHGAVRFHVAFIACCVCDKFMCVCVQKIILYSGLLLGFKLSIIGADSMTTKSVTGALQSVAYFKHGWDKYVISVLIAELQPPNHSLVICLTLQAQNRPLCPKMTGCFFFPSRFVCHSDGQDAISFPTCQSLSIK